MVWPNHSAPPHRAFGAAFNQMPRSGTREQEPGEPQSFLRESGPEKSQADSQLQLSEITAQLASLLATVAAIQATVTTTRDTQNQQGELLQNFMQQLDEKITSQHSVSLTEIRATVERIATSTREILVHPANATKEPALTDAEPDRNERQKETTHTRVVVPKRGETSAKLWVGGFSGHAANGPAHTDEHIERQLREVFPKLSEWKRTSIGSAILSFDTRTDAKEARAKLGETSRFFPHGVRMKAAQGPRPSAQDDTPERRIITGPRQASLVQPHPAITKTPPARHAFDYRSCGESLVLEQDPDRRLTRKEVRAQVQERRGAFFDGNRGARLRGETAAWQAYQAESTRLRGAARASPENSAAARPTAPAAQPDQAPKDGRSGQATGPGHAPPPEPQGDPAPAAAPASAAAATGGRNDPVDEPEEPSGGANPAETPAVATAAAVGETGGRSDEMNEPGPAAEHSGGAKAMGPAPPPEPQGAQASAAATLDALAATSGQNDTTVKPAGPSRVATPNATPDATPAAAIEETGRRGDETNEPAELRGGANNTAAATKSTGPTLRQRPPPYPPCSDEEADTLHGSKPRGRRPAAGTGGGGADAPRSAGTRSEPSHLRAKANTVPPATIRKTHDWDGQSQLWKAGARPYNDEQARLKTGKIACAVPGEGNCFWEVMKRQTGTVHYQANKLLTKKYLDEDYPSESQEPGFIARHDPDSLFNLPHHDDEEAMASIRHNLSTNGEHSDDTVMLLAALAHNAVIRISSTAAPRAPPHTIYNGAKQDSPPSHEIEMLLRQDRTEWIYDINFHTVGRRSDGHFWSIEAAIAPRPGNGRTSEPSRR